MNMGQKRQVAIGVKRLVLALIAVFALGVISDYFMSAPDQRHPLMAGGIAIVVYIVASLGVGIVNAVSGGLYLWLFHHEDITEGVLDDFRRLKIIPPQSVHYRSMEYLAELAHDESRAPQARVNAAILAGAYEVASARSGVFGGIAFRRAVDAAVQRYYEQAPQGLYEADYERQRDQTAL